MKWEGRGRHTDEQKAKGIRPGAQRGKARILNVGGRKLRRWTEEEGAGLDRVAYLVDLDKNRKSPIAKMEKILEVRGGYKTEEDRPWRETMWEKGKETNLEGSSKRGGTLG